MNKKRTFYLRCAGTGFILVEVLVAVSILLLAVPAALTVVSKSVFFGTYSKDQVIATYLAQEGLEIIRNRRDQNMLEDIINSTTGNWKNGFWTPDCKKPKKCIVDMGWGATDPVIQHCVGGCSFVLDKELSGAYAHEHTTGTWTPSPFSRYVQTDDVPGGSSDEIRVSSTVNYKSHGIDKTITLSENLTSWIQ